MSRDHSTVTVPPLLGGLEMLRVPVFVHMLHPVFISIQAETNWWKNLGARGSSSWWKNLCSLDLGRLEDTNEYSVKDVYKDLMPTGTEESRNPWSKIWNKAIPTKVSCLVWRLVQNRIATTDNIVKRAIGLQGQVGCAGGCGSDESVAHLFFECKCFAGIWSSICKWVSVTSVLHNEGWQHMSQFENLLGGGISMSLKLRVLWCAGIWCIWKARNNKIFCNEDIQIIKVLEDVKVFSWKWLKIKSKLIEDDFAMWCLNPKSVCVLSIGSVLYWALRPGSLAVLWMIACIRIYCTTCAAI
ncbi:uncharacterized protein LOC131650010 [Vicia villosa]|uniref:uncharacterized protein LOC131650010 n=1 Tax=Vicia villosa TaxID=3911 RepID=UPI00273CC2FB|nr:uncharacterized protein LOC131650010 [Vicia villosa]